MRTLYFCSACVVVLIIASIVSSAQGAPGYRLDVPSKWQQANNFMGVNTAILGPMEDGARPVILISNAGGKSGHGIKFSDYESGQRAWAKSMSAELLAFYPAEKVTWPNGIQEMKMGFRYKMDGVEYAEQSRYLSCKKGEFHVKTLVQSSQEKKFGSDIEKTIKSFKCD